MTVSTRFYCSVMSHLNLLSPNPLLSPRIAVEETWRYERTYHAGGELYFHELHNFKLSTDMISVNKSQKTIRAREDRRRDDIIKVNRQIV
jgi:hypothetical protein